MKRFDGNLVTGAHSRASARPQVSSGVERFLGKDDTLFAKVTGRVKFADHGAHGRTISIIPVETE